MAGLPEIIDDMRRRIGQLERRQRAQSRTGVVTEVNASKGVARVKLLDSDPPFVTGWVPWAEPSAGANKTFNPPSVGQQVQITSESGDLYDAVIQGSLNSNANAAPGSVGDAHVLASVGSASITISGGGAEMVLKVGGVTATITASGVAIEGGRVTHNGINIGDTHTHSGIVKGPDSTGSPN